MKAENYNKDSVITRKMAWRDFKDTLFRDNWGTRPFHNVTALWVDAVRMVFGTEISRDNAQNAGRILHMLSWAVLIAYVGEAVV